MNCRHIEDKLSEYIDGELPVSEQALVTAHLAQCEACRGELAVMRRTASLARNLGAFQAPPQLAYRLDPAIIAARAAEVEHVSWTARLRSFWVPTAGMATVGATAMMAWVLWRPAVPTPVAQQGPANGTAVATTGIKPAVPVIAPGTTIDAGQGSVTPPATPAPTGEKPHSAARTPRVRRTAEPTEVARAPRAETAEPARRPIRRKHVPVESAPKPAEVQLASVVETAKSLLSQGRYDHAEKVLDAALESAWHRLPEEKRADLQQRNSDADTDIEVCSGALHKDPANVKAREFLGRAYDTKVGILLALAG